jgi:hypothetical protein
MSPLAQTSTKGTPSNKNRLPKRTQDEYIKGLAKYSKENPGELDFLVNDWLNFLFKSKIPEYSHCSRSLQKSDRLVLSFKFYPFC